MADIRINALATTAASTASDDFVAVDGSANGTRKLNAYSPTFGGNLTVSGGTITGGASGMSLAAGGTNQNITLTPSGTGVNTLNGGTTFATSKYIRFGTQFFALGESNTTYLFSGGAGGYVFRNGNDTATLAAITNSGNLTVSGTGTSTFAGNVSVGKATFSTWDTVKALEIGDTLGNSINSGGGTDIRVGANAYYQGGWKYAQTFPSTYYQQYNGVHSWHNAPLGTINTAITFSQPMTLTAAGNLLLGPTSASGSGKLELADHTTSAGGIGFGTDTSLFRSAAGNLQLSASVTSAAIAINNVGSGVAALAYDATGALVYSTGSLRFQTNGSNTALTLDSSQNATFAGTVSLSTTSDKAGLTLNFPAVITGSNGPAMTFKSWTNSASLINSGRIASTITDGSASYGSKLELSVASSGSLTTAFTILQDLSSTAAGTLVANKSTTAFRIPNAETPASASATGSVGTITWDASYIYVCTAANTWKRVAIATWP